MDKNKKIIIGVGIGVAVLAIGATIAYSVSKKKKQEEQDRLEREYQESLRTNTSGTQRPSGTGGEFVTVLGGLFDMFNRNKKDARDIDPIKKTDIARIDNTPTNVPPPNWGFSGMDGGQYHMEVGSELDDLD